MEEGRERIWGRGIAFVKVKVGTQCGIVKSSQVSLVKEMGLRGVFVKV